MDQAFLVALDVGLVDHRFLGRQLVVHPADQIVGQAKKLGLGRFGRLRSGPGLLFVELVLQAIEDFLDLPTPMIEMGDGELLGTDNLFEKCTLETRKYANERQERQKALGNQSDSMPSGGKGEPRSRSLVTRTHMEPFTIKRNSFPMSDTIHQEASGERPKWLGSSSLVIRVTG